MSIRRAPSLAVLLVVVVGGPLAGCFGAPPPPGPDTFVLPDGQGSNVTLKAQITRIISLTPSHTELLFAIGAGPRVVGGTDFDNYPPEAANLTHVLTNLQVNLELTVSLHPDIVLVSSLNNGADIARLRALNLTVFFADASLVGDVPPMIRLIGRAVGEVANATRVASQLEAAVAATSAKVAEATSRPRTFYLLDDFGAWWTAGAGTRGDDLIRVAGGVNVFGNVSGWSSVSLEAVASLNPEVILLGLYVSLNMTAMNTTAPWSTMSAVQGGRVYRVPDADIVDRPGPRLAQGLAWMSAAIHPELA